MVGFRMERGCRSFCLCPLVFLVCVWSCLSYVSSLPLVSFLPSLPFCLSVSVRVCAGLFVCECVAMCVCPFFLTAGRHQLQQDIIPEFCYSELCNKIFPNLEKPNTVSL